jgi:Polyketide cyclase / dehydrase and lipid transport
MNHHTVTTTFEAPPEEVFAYLADIGRLPEWATEFARELKVVDGRHKVVNGLGEFFVELHADEETGVIDMLAGPTEEELAVFPTRVVSMGERRSAFIFTMFEQPGQPEDLFDGQYKSLVRELAIVESRFGG